MHYKAGSLLQKLFVIPHHEVLVNEVEARRQHHIVLHLVLLQRDTAIRLHPLYVSDQTPLQLS